MRPILTAMHPSPRKPMQAENLSPGDPITFTRVQADGERETRGLMIDFVYRPVTPGKMSQLRKKVRLVVEKEGVIEVDIAEIAPDDPAATMYRTAQPMSRPTIARALADPIVNPLSQRIQDTFNFVEQTLTTATPMEHNLRESGASKTDGGKTNWSVLGTQLFNRVAEVMSKAAGEADSKYKPNNWRGLKPYSLRSAMMRHLAELDEGLEIMWEDGMIDNEGVLTAKGLDEVVDEFAGDREAFFLSYIADDESGMNHLDHIATNALMYRKNLVDGVLRELPVVSRIQR